MKHILRKWLAAALAVCMLFSVTATTPTAYAANGTASLSSTAMTESGSIEVTFSQTATSSKYYNVQIVDTAAGSTAWATYGYVYNANVTSGDTFTITKDTGTGLSAGNSYWIYIGYYENGSWKSDALSTTTFTVTEDGATSYGLSLSASDTAPALGDSVTISASFTVDGETVTSVPDDCALSIWYQNDSDWVTPVNGSSTTTSTNISLSSGSFTEGSTYTVEAALYDSDWNTLASDSVTFTVGETSTTDSITLTISDTAPSIGSTITATVSSFTVNGATYTSIPSGYKLSIWYSNDNRSVSLENQTSKNYLEIELDSSYFTAGTTYTVYAGLYTDDSTGSQIATTSASFTIASSGDSGGEEDDDDDYSITLTVSNSAPDIDDTITVTITSIIIGGTEYVSNGSINGSIPSNYCWSVWYGYDNDGWKSDDINSSTSKLSFTIDVSTDRFTEHSSYTVQAALYDTSNQSEWDTVASASVTFTPGGYDSSEYDCSFMRGMDLSTFYTNWTNGAVYYDYDGTRYSQADNNAVAFFQFLYNDCGVNWVRIRVWNDPYDSDGNPYGGGNNNMEVAKIIGKWASDAGMSVLIDFHYSDFWADPGRQLAPKAWADLSTSEKASALYNYTYASLKELILAGVNVNMVQVGNETNGSFCGEIADWTVSDYESSTVWQNIVTLFKKGADAIHQIETDYNTDIDVAFHFTNPNANNPTWYASLLNNAGVDYDAIGISYYSYWHGELSTLASEIATIKSTYGKDVFVAETAYPYTTENFDSLSNSIVDYSTSSWVYNNSTWAISESGQEAALLDILETVLEAGGVGLFYWEPAWTVQDTDEYLKAGCGWATKYSNDYLTDYNITSNEGSSFDNQTLFDNDGQALSGLKFFATYAENNSISLSSDCSHSWGSGTTIATASSTQDGVIKYVCSDCGAVKYELVAYSSTTVPTFYTRTLTLDGGIGLNYYVNPNGLTDDDMANYSVRFTVDGESTTAEFNSGSYRTDLGIDKAYRFTGYLTSVQLADTVTVELLYKNTTVIRTNTYTVKTYCDKAVTNRWDEADLCTALLDYGGYAQTYFSYNTGALANSTNSNASSWSWSNDNVTAATVSLSDVSSIKSATCAMSLTLESKTIVRLYFALADDADVSTLSFHVSDANSKVDEDLTIYTVRASSSDFSDYDYYVELKIPASRLSTEYTFAVTDSASSSGSVVCSALSYVYKQVVGGGTSDNDLLNVCKAIYYYSVAADSYSSWYTGTT